MPPDQNPRHCDSDLEAFEERAAIMEYDGGLSREDAEREAWAITFPGESPQ